MTGVQTCALPICQSEQDAAKGEVAIFGMVPLAGRVSTAALTAGPDGDSGEAERERNVGVGGGAIRLERMPR